MVSEGIIGLIGALVGGGITFATQYFTTRQKIENEAVQRRGEIFIQKEVNSLIELNKSLDELMDAFSNVRKRLEQIETIESSIENDEIRIERLSKCTGTLREDIENLNNSANAFRSKYRYAYAFLEKKERKSFVELHTAIQKYLEISSMEISSPLRSETKELANELLNERQENTEDYDAVDAVKQLTEEVEGDKLDELSQKLEESNNMIEGLTSSNVEEMEKGGLEEEIKIQISTCAIILQEKISEPIEYYKAKT